MGLTRGFDVARDAPVCRRRRKGRIVEKGGRGHAAVQKQSRGAITSRQLCYPRYFSEGLLIAPPSRFLPSLLVLSFIAPRKDTKRDATRTRRAASKSSRSTWRTRRVQTCVTRVLYRSRRIENDSRKGRADGLRLSCRRALANDRVKTRLAVEMVVVFQTRDEGTGGGRVRSVDSPLGIVPRVSWNIFFSLRRRKLETSES